MDPEDIVVCTLHGFARTFEHLFKRLLREVLSQKVVKANEIWWVSGFAGHINLAMGR